MSYHICSFDAHISTWHARFISLSSRSLSLYRQQLADTTRERMPILLHTDEQCRPLRHCKNEKNNTKRILFQPDDRLDRVLMQALDAKESVFVNSPLKGMHCWRDIPVQPWTKPRPSYRSNFSCSPSSFLDSRESSNDVTSNISKDSSDGGDQLEYDHHIWILFADQITTSKRFWTSFVMDFSFCNVLLAEVEVRHQFSLKKDYQLI